MTVLDTYRRIDTSTITTMINALLAKKGVQENVEAHVAEPAAGSKSTEHRVKYTLHSLKQSVNGEMIAPQIYVWNSYNKECSLKVMVGFIRFICSNGMIFGDVTFSERIRHRSGPVCETKLEGLEAALGNAIDYIQDEFYAQAQELIDHQLTESQMIDVVGSLPLSDRIKDKAIQRIVLKHERKRAEDLPNNVWTLWNITNEVIRENTRSALRQDERNRTLLNDITLLAEAA